MATLQSAGAAGIGMARKISIFSTASLSSNGVMGLGCRVRQNINKELKRQEFIKTSAKAMLK